VVAAQLEAYRALAVAAGLLFAAEREQDLTAAEAGLRAAVADAALLAPGAVRAAVAAIDRPERSLLTRYVRSARTDPAGSGLRREARAALAETVDVALDAIRGELGLDTVTAAGSS
jgi:hypothetical protein